MRHAIRVAKGARECLVDMKRTLVTGQACKPIDIAVGDDGLELGVLADGKVLEVEYFGRVSHGQPTPQNSRSSCHGRRTAASRFALAKEWSLGYYLPDLFAFFEE